MNDTIRIKPAPGLRVRDPQTRRLLAEKGEVKPRDGYWMRRLACGDVVEVKNGGKK
ncbi:MAG: DUF2635 domain-containing protein [Gammaproteobacteria bacterium]|nr:MAG: DUF2635 domain-containing protein [Gammaproteobacteria bacterium]